MTLRVWSAGKGPAHMSARRVAGASHSPDTQMQMMLSQLTRPLKELAGAKQDSLLPLMMAMMMGGGGGGGGGAVAAPPPAASRFEAPAKSAAASRAEAPQVPWAFRGGPNTEVGKAIQAMVDRARKFDVKLGGDSVERMLVEGILKNPKVTNEMILKMSKVPLEKLADTPADKAAIERRVPGSRETPTHKFTVALLSAITGVDPKKLSEASPGLGLTGTPSTRLVVPERPGLQRSTALHDTTDYLKHAGVDGLNKAVWGSESSFWSAIKSAAGVPY